jgi:hypothetical protein
LCKQGRHEQGQKSCKCFMFHHFSGVRVLFETLDGELRNQVNFYE